MSCTSLRRTDPEVPRKKIPITCGAVVQSLKPLAEASNSSRSRVALRVTTAMAAIGAPESGFVVLATMPTGATRAPGTPWIWIGFETRSSSG